MHRTVSARVRAFSLLEMLIVIAIIGLIATLVLTNIGGADRQAKKATTMAQIESVAGAVERFNFHVGRYPTEAEMEGFEALLEAPANTTGWEGPYLDSERVPTDGWGRPLKYELDDRWGFKIVSYGADGQPGGEELNADLDNRS